MKRVYISGPMTGIPEYNYPAFFAAEEVLLRAGYDVENPAKNPDPTPKTWENFMRMAVRQLMDCDGVVLLPGWLESKGALVEVNLAKMIGMRVVSLEQVLQEGGHAVERIL